MLCCGWRLMRMEDQALMAKGPWVSYYRMRFFSLKVRESYL
jgi:hypothetical protein